MRRNSNGTTECCDLLLPGVGEVVGGAVREGDPERARRQFQESLMHGQMVARGVNPDEEFAWYFDTLPGDGTHSTGCGIGFERLIQFVSKSLSIKDCVEFPRSPDHILP